MKKLFTLLSLFLCFASGAWAIETDGDGYYLLSSVQDWKDFATLVQTTPNANAKMTADIDLSTDQTMIGSYATRYSGTFDGQGHTLTFNYNTSSMSIESGQSYLGAAPFRDIEGATIRNLRTAGSITADKIGASGLVGWAYGTNTIENCWSDVNIASSNNTADTFTGFVAFMYGTSINITDCIFTGCIQSTSKQSHSGFIGYHNSGTSALTNCLVILDEGSDTNKYDSWIITFFTFDRFASSDQSAGTYTNCYYYRDFGVAQGTKATATQLSDGTIAYKLQNRRGDLVWGQRIGTDTEPVLTNDENYRVYRSKNGGYTNDPEEAYEDIQQDEEGNYLLGSVQDWKDFAGIVNTYPAANAKMTADIDLGDDQTHIGDNNDLSYAYRGVFDGQGHKLNVNYYSSSSSTDVEGGYSIAPFRNINGATIKNLTVTGSITGYRHPAGVVGYTVSPSTNLISNVTVSATINIVESYGGGFIGHCETSTTTIQDCLFNGTINCKAGGSVVGVFFANSNGASMSLTNCLENGSYTNCSTFSPTSCPTGGTTAVTNCYYAVSGSYPGTHATSAQLADGTIATALQNGRAEDVWVQDPVTNQPMLEIFANKISYKVPSSGIGTFSANTAVVLPEGLEAYVCKTYDSGKSTISTQKVEGTIPANTGVLMKGIGGETYTLVASSQTPEAIEGNALIAVVEATHVDQTVGEYTNFMMSGGKFVKIAASSNPNDKIPANRAYLPILTSALPAGSGQSITLNWDEETGVKAVRNAQFMINSYYTLDGRKRNGAPSKGGVYINNGKKVIK